MNRTVIHIVSAAAFALSSSAIAAKCTRVEFTELQSYERRELQAHYCEARLHADTDRKLVDAAREAGVTEDARRYTREALDCIEEGGRARRLMLEKFKAMPECGEQPR